MPQPRALSGAERDQVREVLNSEEHADEAPATVYAKLLDKGVHLASVPTMYRILRANDEVRERRRQATHPAKKKPELIATKPNEVHSWDTTKLLGPTTWTYFYPYVIIDTLAKQGIGRDQLTIHADRGSPMTAKPVALLLADLGVVRSHSRPKVSNDNPYSESQFRTLKCRPEFPGRFGSIEDARASCQELFPWYNTDHHHSGIGLRAPADVHYGRAETVRAQRGLVLGAAYAEHPERFVRKPPEPPALPGTVWINKPKEDASSSQ